MTALLKRNLKIFFRDKAAVFFSLLAVIIVIGLYVLFIGDMVQQGMENVSGARFLMDRWMVAGLLAVSSATTTLGAFGVMVDDRQKKLLKDFSASPLKRSSLAAGYVLSAYTVGVIMSVITFILGQLYIVLSGGQFLSFIETVKVLACIFLSVLASSAMVFFMVSFMSSQNAFATASSVIGTIIGFLTGVYMPIGILPAPVRFVVKVFPVSHAGVLFRQIMMERPMADSFAGAPAELVNSFKTDQGVVFKYGSVTGNWMLSALVLVATAVLFYVLAILNISRKRK